MSEDFERKIGDMAQTIEQLEKERSFIEEKLETTKIKLSDVQDEAQQNQLIHGRDQALSQQSIEFL